MAKEILPENKCFGIVLAGGKSTSLGTPKTLVAWQGKPLFQHAWDLLQPHCQETFLSVSGSMDTVYPPSYARIVDAVPDAGPLGAIHTAMIQQPADRWMVLAADMPLVHQRALSHLSRHAASAEVTLFADPSGIWQPLCASYSSQVLPKFTTALQSENLSMRSLLSNCDVQVLPWHEDIFLNINTPEDLDRLQSLTARD